jgi:hypothetical protein
MLLSNRAFDSELASDQAADILHADASEIGSINLMTTGIARILQIARPESRQSLAEHSSTSRLRNLSSFVAREETFTVQYKMHQDAWREVEQKVLCISKSAEA